MERREELNTKARDLERRGAVDAALQIYLGLVGDSSEAVSGALWVQVGSLQRKLGQNASAKGSFSLAESAFTAAGQFNNALAVCFLLQEMDPDSPDVHLKLGEIALAHGYRGFARSAIAAHAREMSLADRAVEAIGPVAAFVHRYPDEKSLWQEWVTDLLDRGRKAEAIEVLDDLQALLLEGGNPEESSRVGLELLRLRPSERSAVVDDSLPQAWERPVQPAPTSEAVDAAEPLAFLGNSADAERDDPYGPITPLPGLELTDIGSEWESDDIDDIGHLITAPGDEPFGVADLEGNEVGEDLETIDLEPLVFLSPFPADSEEETQSSVTERAWDSSGEDAPPASLPILGSSDEETRPASLPIWDTSDEDEDAQVDPLPIWGSSGDQPGTAASEPDWASAEPDRSSHEKVSDAVAPVQAFRDDGNAVPETEAMDIGWIVTELMPLATKDVDDADSHTHFDLGVAFKEMGLWEESLSNLTRAMSGGYDPIASLEVVGEILVDQGENDLARRLLGGVPGVGSADSPELAGIHYWLGRVAEQVGTTGDARYLFQLVVDAHPDFMDAGQRLLRLAPGTF